MADDAELITLTTWLKETKARHESQLAHIQFLERTNHLDEAGFRALDSTLKKLTSFMKKLKSIGTTVTPTSLLPELERLNVSKFLDEIAANICEAKLKIADIPLLVEFCVKVASLYAAFPGVLIAELRKHVPNKKSDVIANPSKLRVDLRLLADLILHGVLGKEGIQLLGSALSYVMNTDRVEHVNTGVLMPLCRVLLFDFTGVMPLTQHRLSVKFDMEIAADELSTSVLSPDQKTILVNLFRSYLDSLLDHLRTIHSEMNAVHKSIKRQERTRGDALADDRQKFEQLKNNHYRLLQGAGELCECLCVELPTLVDEPSDDEAEDVKRLGVIAGKAIRLWPDQDTQTFYERLVDVSRLFKSDDERDEPGDEHFVKEEITESVNSIDLSNLDNADAQSNSEHSQSDEPFDEREDDNENETTDENADEPTAMNAEELSKLVETDLPGRGTAKEFFAKLTVCINRSLIDNAAVEFLSHFRGKAHEKRLVYHLLNPPTDRFDLLPFYARFLATIRSALPHVTVQVSHELLKTFRELAKRPIASVKRVAGVKKRGAYGRTDQKLHVCNYISELVKFGILPKAEALACLRSLLVDLKQYKVDMLCAMIESMGLFLYRSPDTHAKMAVIMQVMRNKSISLKDPRQQILLDNAYFSVIPPEEQIAPVNRLPPVQEFLTRKIISIENRLNYFRKVNWDDKETSDFLLKLFSNPCRVRFDDLDRLASLVSALSDYQAWLGVCVVDEVVEFIRLFLEENKPALQQRGFSSVIYLGQLFNYNVCGTSLIIKVLYQLITFGLHKGDPADDLLARVQRVRLVCELINVVGEFFCKGGLKTRLDHFLVFLLRFHYENCERWQQIAEELGEFPHDLNYTIKEMLKTWRRGELFPSTLEQAKESVDKLEKQYKTKVEKILRGLYERRGTKLDEQRLNCILEEDEEEEEESDDEPVDQRKRVEEQRAGKFADDVDETASEDGDVDANENGNNADEATAAVVYGDEDDENICVHTAQRVLQPEDEEFMRDFDRMMTESMNASHHGAVKSALTDLEVPPLARQKFERRITFVNAESSSDCAESDTRITAERGKKASLLPDNDNEVATTSSSASAAYQIQMALMTRGKKGTVLKAIRVESSATMHERWRSAQEMRERERREMKQVTLAMNERIQHQLAQQSDEPPLLHPYHTPQQRSGGGGAPTTTLTNDDGMTDLTAIPPGRNAPI